MLSSFFDTRPRRKRSRTNQSPFASSYSRAATPPRDSRLQYNRRRALRYEDELSGSEGRSEDQDESEELDEEDEDNENGDESSPLLPLFDSSRLDVLPVYTLTHTIRLLVISKCETVLTWEQLRSPQVSQFLMKPIQQEIHSNHFSAATIYCLMANCLQFTKETALNPANSGTTQTRAMICELLAIKLLREYTTRGLIDALSYDFDPLQGQLDLKPPPPSTEAHRKSWQATSKRSQPRPARISCLEIAIRAQAKRFLAHPVIVQQLEAIWDGSIVFHAAADSFHRTASPFQPSYGTNGPSTQLPSSSIEGKSQVHVGTRKIVTLYNPRDASLFKLSRLRVPRYRNILSTLSFAILLVLFVAVLVRRSIEITSLEIIFWVWAAGYMMDEITGFTEQGFSLYIASFWNTIDLGILLLLFTHWCLRIYGILMVEDRKHSVASTAYDVLAADAILLFPRLFSVLDHYRYFSQLIIAFRLMSADLVAVFVLIIIFCSGFFVALSLSFGYDGTDNASTVAYALLQMLMGYTPAVWDRWDNYTLLGRTILTLFMFVCHFLILTILVTVLTNSFTAVVKNAHEEHQFIFAINTIQSVKSDALFSFVAPLNVLQWMLHPVRFILPFRQYVKINRTVIKVTHFPILFVIYVYEKAILQLAVVDSTDVVENRKSARSMIAHRLPRLVREPSIANYRQDQALEEVFKQPFDATLRTEILNNPKSSNIVNQWMHDISEEATDPPQEDDSRIVARLEKRRLGERSLSAFSRVRRTSQRAPSLASDPGDVISAADFFSPVQRGVSATVITPSQIELDAGEETSDGDDEMVTNDNDDGMTTDTRSKLAASRHSTSMDYFTQRRSPVSRTPVRPGSFGPDGQNHAGDSSPGIGTLSRGTIRRRPRDHLRHPSSATMIYNPATVQRGSVSPRDRVRVDKTSSPTTAVQSGAQTPISPKPMSSGAGRKTPKAKAPFRMRPAFPSKENLAFRSVPDISSVLGAQMQENKRRPSLEMDLVSDIGDNKAIGGGYVGAVPASFATQIAYATGGLQRLQKENKEEQQMFGRLMMARMNTLEEGFREVIHEVRENLKSNAGTRNHSPKRPERPERPAQARRERRATARLEEKAKGKGVAGGRTAMKSSDSAGSSAREDHAQRNKPATEPQATEVREEERPNTATKVEPEERRREEDEIPGVEKTNHTDTKQDDWEERHSV